MTSFWANHINISDQWKLILPDSRHKTSPRLKISQPLLRSNKQKLGNFLEHMAKFAISFVTHHNSLGYRRELQKRFRQAITRAAVAKSRLWHLRPEIVWELFTDRIERKLHTEHYHKSTKLLIHRTLPGNLFRHMPPPIRPLANLNAPSPKRYKLKHSSHV